MQTVLYNKGKTVVQVAEQNGVPEATKEAMKFSFYDDVDILNASYILLILKVPSSVW